MKTEEKLTALESLLEWLEDGGEWMVNQPYFGMCTWVKIYHGEDGEAMNYEEAEQYLITLGLVRPESGPINWWFPSTQSAPRIALVKEAIERLKSNS